MAHDDPTAATPTAVAEKSQTWRVEVRFDVTGTEAEARVAGQAASALLDGEVTAIFDEAWNEL
jgi:hypothetical protein